MIVILFTGGTITMRNDPGGGGAQPGLTAAEILQATKGIRADTILRELAAAAGGKGGGKPHMAQAGIPDAERMASVVAEAPDLIRKHLSSAG